MEAKQKAIQAAFGSHWNTVRHYVDSDGWLDTYIYSISYSIPCEIHESGGAERPVVLSGIENNNGWFRYDEKQPETDQRIFYCLENIPSPVPCDYHPTMPMCSLMTHWMPADAPKPPIY